MTNYRRIAILAVSIFAVASNLSASSVEACSVCYGDADSKMTAGALAGVAVLGAIVYGTLLGFVGLAITWHRRARRLQDTSSNEQ